jgi:hypothetical protein
MVHNIMTKTLLPFRGQVMQKKGKHVQGMGMGSVLLNKGGAGSASSYIDIDDYVNQTGNNPFKGQGLKNLGEITKRLQKLTPNADIRKRNITM